MDRVGISGGADLAKALAEFPVKLEVQVMAQALRGGAKVIESAARANVPVASGDLRASIKIRRRTNKRTGYVNLLVTAGDRKAWYAHIVEFGSGSRYTGTGSKSKRAPDKIRAKKGKALLIAGGAMLREVTHPGARANAFMRRAFDAQGEAAVAEITRITARGVERLGNRRAKGLI